MTHKDDYPKIAQMEQAIERHGEVHATLSDIDDEVEFRLGPTYFDYVNGLISVEDGVTMHHFRMDDVVTWYRPYSLYHE